MAGNDNAGKGFVPKGGPGRTFYVLLGFVLLFVGTPAFLVAGGQASDEMGGLAAGVCGGLCIVVAIFLFAYKKTDAKEKARRLEAQRAAYVAKKDKQEKERIAAERAKRICVMPHVAGLPLAEGVEVTITSTPKRMRFEAGQMRFDLFREKIADVCMKQEGEVVKQYVSSVGGAVGGAILFGPVGAVIGGRAKKRTVSDNRRTYLIVTYISDEGPAYLGFEVESGIFSRSYDAAELFVEDFRNQKVKASFVQEL